MKQQIAIIGSCASRDVFRNDMNLGYKDIFSCCFMQDKISLISMVSKYQLNLEGIDLLAEWERIMYQREMNKNVIEELIASNPDYIIIDLFADAYFGVNEFSEGQYVTYNFWHPHTLQEKMKIGKRIAVDTDREKYCLLLRNAIDNFINIVHEQLSNTKLLFNNIRFATEFINVPNGYSNFYDYNSVNQCFDIVSDVIREFNLPEINIFEKFKVRGDFNHLWGFGGAHYEKKYYREFYSRFVEICLKDQMDKRVEKLAYKSIIGQQFSC